MTALADTSDGTAAARAGGRERTGLPGLILAILLVLLALWLMWRILAWGMADWLAGAEKGDHARIHAALDWVPDHPRALFLAAQQDRETRPAEARAHLERLVRVVPTNAWAWLNLAELTPLDDGDRLRACLDTAQRLAPWDGDLHLQAGNQWLRLGDLSRAVAAWDRAMEAAPRLRRALFAQLETLVGYLDSVDFLADVARRHPAWWPDFFRSMVRPPTDLTLVRALYALNGGAGEGREAERKALLHRLVQEGLWEEAYLTWLNALDDRQRRHLGLVFNGGFELPLTGMGFDWRFRPSGGVKLERRRTYGISGDRALALHYRGKRVVDWHLAQYLLLPPGRYRLQYRARPDSLKAAEGVRVVIRCRGDGGRRLASGQRLLGVYQWRIDVMEWTVPEVGCPAQELGLEVVAERHRDRKVKGVLWLDDFRLRPVVEHKQ